MNSIEIFLDPPKHTTPSKVERRSFNTKRLTFTSQDVLESDINV